MSRETPGPGERPNNVEEERYENETERRFARLLSAQREAEAIVEVVSEIGPGLLPDSVKRRLASALHELEQIGRDSLTPAIGEDRAAEIETSYRSRQSVDSELQDIRGRVRKNSRIAELNRHLTLMHASWDEAYDRLPPQSSADSLIAFTHETRSVDAVQEYLKEHQPRLTPEEVFFLQATIELCKAKNALAAAEGAGL